MEMSNLLKGLLIALVAVVVGSLLFLTTCVTTVNYHSVGYRYDALSGEIEILPKPGWYVHKPFIVSIGEVDTRPVQVCINANNRVLNCKLVRFNPKGLATFLQWHGRDHGSVSEILKSYAYDGTGKEYPFLEILQEVRQQEPKPAEEVAP